VKHFYNIRNQLQTSIEAEAKAKNAATTPLPGQLHSCASSVKRLHTESCKCPTDICTFLSGGYRCSKLQFYL